MKFGARKHYPIGTPVIIRNKSGKIYIVTNQILNNIVYTCINDGSSGTIPIFHVRTSSFTRALFLLKLIKLKNTDCSDFKLLNSAKANIIGKTTAVKLFGKITDKLPREWGTCNEAEALELVKFYTKKHNGWVDVDNFTKLLQKTVGMSIANGTLDFFIKERSVVNIITGAMLLEPPTFKLLLDPEYIKIFKKLSVWIFIKKLMIDTEVSDSLRALALSDQF